MIFIHLLDLTRSSCEKCNTPSLQESNLRPYVAGSIPARGHVVAFFATATGISSLINVV